MRSWVWITVVVSLAGCISATPEDAQPRLLAQTSNVWADCYRRFQPGGDDAADLAALAESCAAPAGMHEIAAHVGAEQRAGDSPERLAFRAARGCYRVFAVGGPGVDDLDVAVYDGNGRLAAGDVSRDRWPIVPPRGPRCIEEEGAYTVAVSVAHGRGDYVLSIWGVGRR